MSRVNDALSTLVKALLPSAPQESESSAKTRHHEGLDLAKSILENYTNSAESHDINLVSDLIKKRLWRENSSPEKAVQYGNLYSRLLTLPILQQKWAILFLLHQLANGRTQEEADSTSPVSGDRSLTESTLRYHQLPRPEEPRSRDGAERPSEHWTTDAVRPAESMEEPLDSTTPTRNISMIDQPSESALLRDLPFTLQGLSSTNFAFSNATLAVPVNLPLPIVSLLYTLAEPSLLYRSLSKFVESRDEGLVGQSLRAAIGIELRSYLGLITKVESDIRKASLKHLDDRPSGTIATLTLKRCVLLTRDATLGLRLMSLMAEESKSKKGGQLISLIHAFSTSYGDPFVSDFAERMLAHLTAPFYDMLRQWIYDGELSDPYHEFFVIEHQPEKNETKEGDTRRLAASVWEDKYKLNDKTVPTIITEEFAKKVFLIGKSLNFIRYSCGDSAWVEAYSKEASKELRYGDTATLETSIDKAYKATMARLIYLMNERFRLSEHLTALKKYLLLGQGDFIALLMESLASNLDRPAGSQYRHTLTAQLEHAIRGSNAQYDSPEVHRRLDARLLEMENGDIGWDVFTLEYKVDAPVDVVITPWANKQYLIVFNFLWRIKRVEFALGSTWRRCMTGARGVLASVNEKLGRDWKVARCCIAEMIHFVNQLQYYVLFEVIEASWDQLQAAMAKPGCTLDDLIDAHTAYLRAITHKGLLGSSRSSITGAREDGFASQLHYILKVMLAYKDAVDGLYSYSVAEFTRSQEAAAKIQVRTAAQAQAHAKSTMDSELDDAAADPVSAPPPRLPLLSHPPGRTDSPLPSLLALGTALNDDQMLPALRKRLHDLSADFKSLLVTLLGDLMAQSDVDMKFLGVVMNFNDVYRPRRRKRPESGVAGGVSAAVGTAAGVGRH